ncbi:MAG: SRPBCC family protein [Geminicoccaceae bacterium]
MRVEVRKTIAVPAEQVWSKLRTFDELDKWLPIVSTCSIETTANGIKRYCGFADGTNIVENLVERDDFSTTLHYNIEDGAMPFTGHKATIAVRDAGSGWSEVTWSSTMEAGPGAEEAVRGMLEAAYSAGIAGLEGLCLAEQERSLSALVH